DEPQGPGEGRAADSTLIAAGRLRRRSPSPRSCLWRRTFTSGPPRRTRHRQVTRSSPFPFAVLRFPLAVVITGEPRLPAIACSGGPSGPREERGQPSVSAFFALPVSRFPFLTGYLGSSITSRCPAFTSVRVCRLPLGHSISIRSAFVCRPSLNVSGSSAFDR